MGVKSNLNQPSMPAPFDPKSDNSLSKVYDSIKEALSTIGKAMEGLEDRPLEEWAKSSDVVSSWPSDE